MEVNKCAVCDICMPKARVHYGGVTCYSCRAFFRRATQRGVEGTCTRGGNCVITKNDRKECTICRYEKCLNIGMKRSLVLTENEKQIRFRNRNLKKKTRKPTVKEPVEPDTTCSTDLLSHRPLFINEREAVDRYERQFSVLNGMGPHGFPVPRLNSISSASSNSTQDFFSAIHQSPLKRDNSLMFPPPVAPVPLWTKIPVIRYALPSRTISSEDAISELSSSLKEEACDLREHASKPQSSKSDKSHALTEYSQNEEQCSPLDIENLDENIGMSLLNTEVCSVNQMITRYVAYRHKKLRRTIRTPSERDMDGRPHTHQSLTFEDKRSVIYVKKQDDLRNGYPSDDEPSLADKHLLDIIFKTDISFIEQLCRKEELQFLEERNSRFWKLWHSFNLGNEHFLTYKEWAVEGKPLSPMFFVQGNRQVCSRLLGAAAEDYLSEINIHDFELLMRYNIQTGAHLFTIWNFNSKDLNELYYNVLGREEWGSWMSVRLMPLEDMMTMGPFSSECIKKIMKIMNANRKPHLRDRKIFYILLGIILCNPRTPGLQDPQSVIANQEILIRLLRRHFQQERIVYNEDHALRDGMCCVSESDNLKDLLLSLQ